MPSGGGDRFAVLPPANVLSSLRDKGMPKEGFSRMMMEFLK
jgi:hypothetical protein